MRSIKASRRAALFFAAMALLVIPSLSAHGEMFTDIAAFGDSLSDNGNLYRLTAHVIPDSSDYYEGRFSNGPVWVESLTAQLGAVLDDFAYGGASTSGGIIFIPSLKGQINRWQPKDVLEETLVTVWAGANDYLLVGSTDAQTAVGNILSGLETLAADGASRILLLNLPDLGLTPDLLSETTTAQAEATAYSLDFNQRIGESLVFFSGDHPGVVIYFLDVYGLFKELVTDPEMFGFQNSTEVSPNFGVNFQNDGGYVFWDGVHPTTEAHAFLAQEAANLLSKDCARVGFDLSMDLFFVDYAGVRFAFTLNYIGGIAGDPDGFYWKMDLPTLGVESDNILGIDHVVAADDLDLIVPCAEFGGNRYAFRLDFVESGGAGTFLWRLDLSSLTVK
jgi:phospholipase/lecithinase/hemolysin